MTFYYCDGKQEKCGDLILFLFCISRHLLGDQEGDRIDWNKTLAPLRRAWIKWWWQKERKNRYKH